MAPYRRSQARADNKRLATLRSARDKPPVTLPATRSRRSIKGRAAQEKIVPSLSPRRSRSTKRRAQALTTQPQSTLLNLPPEIRNMIYEWTLIDSVKEPYESRILVVRTLQLPGLLATCRQVQQEATKLYFSLNSFVIDITDLDATLLDRWTDSKLRTTSTRGRNPLYRLHVSKNFTNLEKWCRAVHKGKHLIITKKADMRHATAAVVHTALKIARSFRGRPWRECESLLRHYRDTLNSLDGGDDYKQWM